MLLPLLLLLLLTRTPFSAFILTTHSCLSCSYWGGASRPAAARPCSTVYNPEVWLIAYPGRLTLSYLQLLISGCWPAPAT